MAERKLYIPPDFAPQDERLAFLGGPIQGVDDWQSTAINILFNISPNIAIASPRRPRFNIKNKQLYEEQVDWETHHLNQAGRNGVIMFWLPKEMYHDPSRAYGQTTRGELFEWKTKNTYEGAKIVVGIEQDWVEEEQGISDAFTGSKYIRHRFKENPTIPILSTLEETCQAVVDALKR